MCLEELADFSVKLDENGIGIGWKVFYKNIDGKLIGDFKSRSAERPKNKWLKEGNFRPGEYRHAKKTGYPSYAIGFHVFLTRDGAERWRNGLSDAHTKKIRFKRLVAMGFQLEHRCVVAKEIFIPNEVKHD